MRRPYDQGIFTRIDTFWDIHHSIHKEITAFMVTPKEYVGLMQMYQEVNNGMQAQGVFPGQVIGNLFDIMGKGEDILTMIARAVAVLGLITAMISASWSVLNRKRENAIYRALGASRLTIFRMVILESLFVMLVSVILGAAFGHLIAGLADLYMRQQAAIYSPIFFVWEEVWLLLLYVTSGVLGAVIPAASVYGEDVAGNLRNVT